MSDPCVGIVVCTYNKPDQLENSLRLIKEQTYQNYSVIVVDDYSTCAERNRDVCDSFEGSIEYICNTANCGIAWTRNEGIKYFMSSQQKPSFICMLDDDDYWPKDRLAKGVNAMEPGVGMSYGIQYMADDLLRPIVKYPCNVNYNRARLHALVLNWTSVTYVPSTLPCW